MAWSLSAQSVLDLALALLLLLIATYLFSLRQKSKATRWLAGYCAVFGVVLTAFFFSTAVVPGEAYRAFQTVVHVLGLGGLPLGIACYLQFAYLFQGDPFPREARAVRYGGLGVTGAYALALGVDAFRTGTISRLALLYAPLLVLVTLWAAVVFWRKAAHFAGRPDPEGGRQARACRTYAGLTMALLGTFMVSALIWLGGMTMLYPLYAVTAIAVACGFVVLYVNHAPEETTFQVKLVGLSLATMLAVLGMLGPILYPDADMARASGVMLPQGEALRFTQEGAGAYQAQAQPLRFDEAPGERLNVAGDGAATVPLGFAFPFYGQAWTDVHVSENGVVAFGAPFAPRSRYEFFSRQPKIALLLLDLDARRGGVFARREADRLVITWQAVPQANTDNRSTMQLVLHRDGAVDMRYGRVAYAVRTSWWDYVGDYGLRGLYPGGEAAVPWIEDYTQRYRRYQHEKVGRLIAAVLGATLFILLAFPLFFRTSLVGPLSALLDGVRRVDEGNLDVRVPVRVNDEIGMLAQRFNSMTANLKAAEGKLRHYAENLEGEVAARTAELEASLQELKAAQAQLVQQEKLASLGQLTAGIAHEIKNPLNFVNNFAALSRELVGELEEALGHRPEARLADLQDVLRDLKLNAERIEVHGRRADGIVRAMLEHSHRGTGARQPTRVNELVDEYVNLAYHGMRARTAGFEVQIERDYDAAVGTAEMAPQEIGRVLINLLNNAFDAVQERTGQDRGSYMPLVRVSTREKGEGVEIQVCDNGPGIPIALQERIFEPFFTTKPAGSGTGLGLSLAHEIVVQGHRGTLRVESQGRPFTTFTLWLPA